MTMFRRKPRVLTQLAISEVSAVDKAAAPGARIMLRKRARVASRAEFDKAVVCLAKSVDSIMADDTVTDKNAMLSRSFGQFLYHVNPRVSLAEVAKLHAIFKNTDDTPSDFTDDEEAAQLDEGMDTDEDGGVGSHRAGDEGNAGGESTDQLERARRALKGENMQTHSELMSAVVKKYGITAFCKSVAQGDVAVSEHRLTELINEHAARAGTTFAKLFEAQDERGVTLRKAIAAARDAQFFQPHVQGGDADPARHRRSGGAGRR
jgi:hypothetical protein